MGSLPATIVLSTHHRPGIVLGASRYHLSWLSEARVLSTSQLGTLRLGGEESLAEDLTVDKRPSPDRAHASVWHYGGTLSLHGSFYQLITLASWNVSFLPGSRPDGYSPSP